MTKQPDTQLIPNCIFLPLCAGWGIFFDALLSYWYGFTSTSRDLSEAQKFGPIIFMIKLNHSQRNAVATITAFSQYVNEKEILINPNCGFKVFFLLVITTSQVLANERTQVGRIIAIELCDENFTISLNPHAILFCRYFDFYR